MSAADRELLELAAKAAGARWTDYSDRTPDHWTIRHSDGVWRAWSPLTDDGDRLRLMRALKMNIDYADCSVSARHSFGRHLALESWWGGGDEGDEAHAVLRVAAEIGKATPTAQPMLPAAAPAEHSFCGGRAAVAYDPRQPLDWGQGGACTICAGTRVTFGKRCACATEQNGAKHE